jgi:hypothetical protein
MKCKYNNRHEIHIAASCGRVRIRKLRLEALVDYSDSLGALSRSAGWFFGRVLRGGFGHRRLLSAAMISQVC